MDAEHVCHFLCGVKQTIYLLECYRPCNTDIVCHENEIELRKVITEVCNTDFVLADYGVQPTRDTTIMILIVVCSTGCLSLQMTRTVETRQHWLTAGPSKIARLVKGVADGI